MPELIGWTTGQDGSSVHPAPGDLNARQENLRFRHDCSTHSGRSRERRFGMECRSRAGAKPSYSSTTTRREQISRKESRALQSK
eukprot:11960986-Heterocapsa_arctica.AAC.1